MSTQVSPAARSELAPTGTLRVGINLGNFLLVTKDPATGALERHRDRSGAGAWAVALVFPSSSPPTPGPESWPRR